jgi:glutamate racemase
MKNKKQAIGIFDSGVGGLTVFKEIRKQFPTEDIIYFGDTARVPYGPKSSNTVLEYSIQNARFLIQHNVKVIVIACNTSTSVALEVLKKIFDIPVIGVIEPGSKKAVEVSQNKKIGVIGTEGTIKSKAYRKTISSLQKDSIIFEKSCPLFVSLAEEGWENHKIASIITKEYLSEIVKKEIDTLVLGCTHYPILKDTIQKFVGEKITLVDSAIEISKSLKSIIKIDKHNQISGKNYFYVSDNEDKFKELASRILNEKINTVQKVYLGESWFLKNNEV